MQVKHTVSMGTLGSLDFWFSYISELFCFQILFLYVRKSGWGGLQFACTQPLSI